MQYGTHLFYYDGCTAENELLQKKRETKKICVETSKTLKIKGGPTNYISGDK